MPCVPRGPIRLARRSIRFVLTSDLSGVVNTRRLSAVHDWRRRSVIGSPTQLGAKPDDRLHVVRVAPPVHHILEHA
jgi:hypothetical protein